MHDDMVMINGKEDLRAMREENLYLCKDLGKSLQEGAFVAKDSFESVLK